MKHVIVDPAASHWSHECAVKLTQDSVGKETKNAQGKEQVTQCYDTLVPGLAPE